MFYKNFSKIELNKEVTRIIKLIIKDEESGYELLSKKEYNNLVVRVRELEVRLNTTIVMHNFPI